MLGGLAGGAGEAGDATDAIERRQKATAKGPPAAGLRTGRISATATKIEKRGFVYWRRCNDELQ